MDLMTVDHQLLTNQVHGGQYLEMPQINPMQPQYNSHASETSVATYAKKDQENYSQVEHNNYLQGKSMSYTQMLLGVEMSAESDYYKNLLEGPMGEENKLFMITGRYSDVNDIIQEGDSFEQEKSIQIANRAFEDEVCTKQNGNSATHDAAISDGEWEDPAVEYDIFDDNNDQQPAAHVDHASNIATDHAPTVSGEEHNNDEQPTTRVEELSQEDINSFIERDNVETCSQEVRRQLTPHVNMIFDTDEAAYRFYNEYAAVCGFSVKKAGNYHAKKTGSTGHTRATFVCNRSGKVLDQ